MITLSKEEADAYRSAALKESHEVDGPQVVNILEHFFGVPGCVQYASQYDDSQKATDFIVTVGGKEIRIASKTKRAKKESMYEDNVAEFYLRLKSQQGYPTEYDKLPASDVTYLFCGNKHYDEDLIDDWWLLSKEVYTQWYKHPRVERRIYDREMNKDNTILRYFKISSFPDTLKVGRGNVKTGYIQNFADRTYATIDYTQSPTVWWD
jgi:hypothetical protein